MSVLDDPRYSGHSGITFRQDVSMTEMIDGLKRMVEAGEGEEFEIIITKATLAKKPYCRTCNRELVCV